MSSDLREQLQAALGADHRVDRELPGGGIAHVFLAEDVGQSRWIVAKVLRADLSAGVSIERFRREIAVASQLKHPAIVPVLNTGQSDDLLFYTMPYIDGESLRTRLARERQMPVDLALRLTLDVADALAHAHAKNIVHRDIKPDNILVNSEGRALVTDFGIARAIERASDLASVTSTGTALGTPAYMSPEQASGEKAIDGRSDIYSLGCVLYEMLGGQPPFTGTTARAVIARHLHEPPPPLRIIRPQLSTQLQQVVETALAKVPADRFPTVAAFAAAVRAPAANISPRLARSDRLSLGWLLPRASIVSAVALLGWLVWEMDWVRGRGASSATRELDPRRIAVLYFDDHSADRSLDYLASGLTESLIHELSAVSAIQVVSRNGVKQFKDASPSVDSVANRLRAGSLVEGSVQRSGDRIRVSVQLIDARTNTRLQSAQIERQMGELFLLEDDIARQVATLLRRRLGTEIRIRETTAATRSARARELVFRADKLRNEAETATRHDTLEVAQGLVRLRAADSLLAIAEQADRSWIGPVIDRGWAALAIALMRSGEPRVRAFDSALAHAGRAIRRDPAAAPALELRGTTLYFQAARLPLGDKQFGDNLHRAQTDLEAAVRIDSTLANAWGTLSRVQVARGDVSEAERNARTALRMDAYLKDAPEVLLSLYMATLMRDSLAPSWRWCEQGAAEYPRDARFVDCRLTLLAEDASRRPDPRLAWSLVAEGNRLDSPSRAQALGRPWLPIYREMLAAIVSARAGEKDSALAVAAKARRTVAGNEELGVDLKYEEALLQLVLGDRRAAIALLAEYLAARPSLRGLVGRHPRWRPLWPDSSFQSLVRRVPRASTSLGFVGRQAHPATAG